MKKGIIKSVAVMVLLLIFLGVMLFIFFGKQGLPFLAKKANEFGEEQIGIIRTENPKEEPVISQDSSKAFDKIISLIDTTKKGPCLLQYEKLPDTKETIKLSSVEEGMFAQLINENEQTVKTKTLRNAKPCVVDGTTAENFINNNLLSKCSDNCPTDYKNADLEITSDGILVNGQEFDSEDEGFLYRTKEGSVCFFATSNVVFSRLWSGECNFDNDGLYETCLEDIKEGKYQNNIGTCE